MKEKTINQPQPVQRSRKAKQVSPNGLPVKYVGRPSRYGNPFKVEADIIYGNASYRRTILTPWIFIEVINPSKAPARLVELYKKWIDNHPEVLDMHINPCPFTREDLRKELKDKNLSCWCKLGEPCHRNVLLDIAAKRKFAILKRDNTPKYKPKTWILGALPDDLDL